MGITFNTAELRAALSRACLVSERRSTIPILSTVLVSAKNGIAKLTVTDLDIRFEVEIPVDGDPDGKLAIDVRSFARIASVSGETVTITRDATHFAGRAQLCLAFSDGEMTVRLNDIFVPEDFPSTMESLPAGGGVEISEGALHRALSSVGVCISTEETRYYLNGIFMTGHPETGAMRLVATDGHRMGIYDFPDMGKLPDAIIPRKTVKVLLRLIRADGNRCIAMSRHKVDDRSPGYIQFRGDGWMLKSQVIDGKFPDYTRVLPKGEERRQITISREQARRMMLMATVSGESRACGFDFQKKLMFVRQNDLGAVEMPSQVEVLDGDRSPKNVGFNVRYLEGILSATKASAMVMTGVGDRPEGNAWLFRTEDAALTGVLMPMRV